jgi:NDP-sugar pyrophosphorylase family protein
MDFAIIAAGEGSRLVQEGITTPKPLITIQGQPLIERLIRIFLRNDATSISVIVNEEMTEVQDFLKKIRLPVPFHLHVRTTPSSMHSFYELSRYLRNDRFCLTTVDTIFREEEFSGFVQAFQASEKIDGLMAVTDFVDDEKPLYVKTDKVMKILGFEDSQPESQSYIPLPSSKGDKELLSPFGRDMGEKELLSPFGGGEGEVGIFVSGGIYCLKRTGIDVLEKAIAEGMSRMRNYQRRLVSEGLYLMAYPFAKIIDVDHAEDIGKAEGFLAQKDITTKAHKGISQRNTKD